MAIAHTEDKYLYRVFYYDCLPFDKQIHNPVDSSLFDFARSHIAIQRSEVFEELKKKRKAALRLGKKKVAYSAPADQRAIEWSENDKRSYKWRCVIQKGVDIKIGVDIASLSFQKLVHQIVLVSGDSDFVPAAKLARRQGIDFILDTMWGNVEKKLFEHIDGHVNKCPEPT